MKRLFMKTLQGFGNGDSDVEYFLKALWIDSYSLEMIFVQFKAFDKAFDLKSDKILGTISYIKS